VSDSTAFQEVDDAVRKDQLKEWWVRWGTWLVGGVVLIGFGIVLLWGAIFFVHKAR